LLKHLPADSRLGFVLVQHLDPNHESALTEILGRVTAMPASEVANDQALLPNHVYIIPPNASLIIQQGVLTSNLGSRRGPQRSIDHFFQSLAEDLHERAIEALKRVVFPKLLPPQPEDSGRVWVLGCSTGQEAYPRRWRLKSIADRLRTTDRRGRFL
jgi:hypothetical protein